MDQNTTTLHEPTESEIQKKAFYLWLEGGCREGTELDNWFAAKELLMHHHGRVIETRHKPIRSPSSTNEAKGPSGDTPANSIHFPTKWAWHGQTLVAMRDRLQQQARSHLAEVGELNDDPSFAARSGDESELDTLLAEVRSEKNLLGEVQAALDRLQSGTYGLCEARGEPIPMERLRAMPWTRFCRKHAAAQS